MTVLLGECGFNDQVAIDAKSVLTFVKCLLALDQKTQMKKLHSNFLKIVRVQAQVHPKHVKQGVVQNANRPIAFLFPDAFQAKHTRMSVF